MTCPRLDHFVRLNPNGTLSCCGHMVEPQQFDSLELMHTSEWLQDVKEKFKNNVWPTECQRCQQTEAENGTSIRLYAIDLDRKESTKDYLQVGGVLDNLCNAACLSCNPMCSTRIGSLTSPLFPIVNNTTKFWELPQERILHLDINGGEPSFSKNYKKLLENLPPHLKTLRLNTNCSTVLTNLIDVVSRGVDVTVTASIDGVGDVFDLARWPVTWEEFYKNLMAYREMPVTLNLWTTVSALNVDDLPNIIAFAKEHNVDHSYAYLKHPQELAVENSRRPESLEYIQQQKSLRGIL